MTELDDLRRRLTDLADASGPWDDPLPEIRRRVEIARRQSPPVHRRWLASTNWGAVLTAAIVVIVIGFGGYLIAQGGGTSEKSATSGGGAPVAGPAARGEASCYAPDLAAGRQVGRLQLSAPRRFETDRQVRVQARLTTAAAATGAEFGPLRVFVLFDGGLVGRLDVAVGGSLTTAGPGSADQTASVNGIFHRYAANSECPAPNGMPSGASSLGSGSTGAGRLLPPGNYQLVATVGYHGAHLSGGDATGEVVSDPVDITVI